MAGGVALTGWIRIPPGEAAALRPLLEEHIGLTRAEPGCLAFAVTANPADPARFDVAERFCDRAAFEAHQRRAAASAWPRDPPSRAQLPRGGRGSLKPARRLEALRLDQRYLLCRLLRDLEAIHDFACV